LEGWTVIYLQSKGYGKAVVREGYHVLFLNDSKRWDARVIVFSGRLNK
jgi:hypothetical protein